MKRTASAIWKGDLPTGSGTISATSGVLDNAAYSFRTRFEDGTTGTNPEELIAAAHAGSFSMALSNALAKAGHAPQSVATTATVHLDKVEGGFAISRVHLDGEASVPGMEQAAFDRIAEEAKAGCPVSKVLNAEITLDMRLLG
jgi:osmotically inducible protein OsmC